LVTILYSVPGENSEVKYGAGTSSGSKVEDTASFKQGLVVEVEAEVIKVTGGYDVTSKDGHSIEVKKDQSTTLFVGGTGTTINHDHDKFYLWTNPEIDIVETGPNSIKQTVKTRDGKDWAIVDVTAAELQNPSLLPQWKKLPWPN